MKVPVSILIPIKNEAANLPRCLAAVAWADEIFVVDSNSTDGSQAIVDEFARSVVRGQNFPPSPRWGEGRGEVSPSSTFHPPPSDSMVRDPRIKLVQFAFNGTWPKKKNWALENLPFKHEWVFILDADEVMPPEAEAEFRDIVAGKAEMGKVESRNPVAAPISDLRSPTSVPVVRGPLSSGQLSKGHPPSSILHHQGAGEEIVGYWINRRFMFMGQWLKHAYYPNWNLRLFKHRLGRYEKLTDVATASGDNEVHEHVVVQGKTGHLKCEMDHYAFPSVDVFVEKHNRYSNWEARVALDQLLPGSSRSLQSRQVGLRRRLKLLSQRLPFRPLLRFLYVYLWQRGFLDGKAGYHFARLHGVYEYLCVVKTVELKKR